MNKALLVNGFILLVGGILAALILTQVDPGALSQSFFPLIFLAISLGMFVYSIMVYILFFAGELIWGRGKLGKTYFRVCICRSLFAGLVLLSWGGLYWLDMLTWIEFVTVFLFFGFLELFLSFQTK